VVLGDSGKIWLSANAGEGFCPSSNEMRLGSLGSVRTGVGVLTRSDNLDGPAAEMEAVGAEEVRCTEDVGDL